VIDTYTSHKEMEEVDETLIDNFINRMDDINKFPFFYLLTRKKIKRKLPFEVQCVNKSSATSPWSKWHS
jgi:hypothetical protein